MRQLNLKSHYDLIIIGGGIQGCAMFWEAQSRGLKTLLVEERDFCSRTSANSLKTIHGGIRYLQTLNLARTWRSSREPEIFLKIAPHLVHEMGCLLPTEHSPKRSRAVVTAGFAFYNLIKRFSCPTQRLPRARCLSKVQLAGLTSLLDDPSVTGAGLWFDAQVQHAERLGLAFVDSARSAGGDAYNYLKATTLTATGGQSMSVLLDDRIDHQSCQVNADSIIYCTASDTACNLSQFAAGEVAGGPQFCLAMNLGANKKYADFAIGLQSGFASQSKPVTRRLLFSAPWRNSTLFGTWYFQLSSGNRDRQSPTEKQISYCLDDINNSYPDMNLRLEDVAVVHAGLLPVNGHQADPENHLMEHDLVTQPDKSVNVFSVIPTKFTTCRITAQMMIDQLGEKISTPLSPSISAEKTLIGGETGPEYSAFVEKCHHRFHSLLSRPVIEQLCVSYGDRIDRIIELCEADKDLADLIPGSKNHVKAQLIYELNQGSVFKPGDFIHRRSFLGSDRDLNNRAVSYCCETINHFHGINPDIEKQVNEMLSITLY